MKYNWHIFNDFSKGINKAVSDHLLQDNEAAWQKNVHLGMRHLGYGGRGALQKRPGMEEFPKQLPTSHEDIKIHSSAHYRMRDGDGDIKDVNFFAAGMWLWRWVPDTFAQVPSPLQKEQKEYKRDTDPFQWQSFGVSGGEQHDFNPSGNRVSFEEFKNYLFAATGNNIFYVKYEHSPTTAVPIALEPPDRVTMGTTADFSNYPYATMAPGTYRYRLAFYDDNGFVSGASDYREVVVDATTGSYNAVRFYNNSGNPVLPQPIRTDGVYHRMYRTKVTDTTTYYEVPYLYKGNAPITFDYLFVEDNVYDMLRDDQLGNAIEIHDENEGTHPAENAKNPLAYKNRLLWLSENKLWYSERGEPLNYNTEGTLNYYPISARNDDLEALTVTRHGVLVMSKSETYLFNIDPANLRLINASVGIASEFAKASDGNYAYFLSQENKIYRSDGVNMEYISALIDNELKHLDDETWDKISMAVYDDILHITFPNGDDYRMFEYSILSGDWTEDVGRNGKLLFASPRMVDPKMFIIKEVKGQDMVYESHRLSPPWDGNTNHPVKLERTTKYTDFGMPDHDKTIRAIRMKVLCYTLVQDEIEPLNRYILGNTKTQFTIGIKIFSDYQDSYRDESYWEQALVFDSDNPVVEVSVPPTVKGRVFKFEITEESKTSENEYVAIEELAVRYKYNEEKYVS